MTFSEDQICSQIPAYVINLDRAADRLEHVRREFDRYGLEFVRVSAVDKILIADDELHERELTTGRPWSKSQMAVLRSHMAVWKLIAEGSHPSGAVFEDDVHFTPNIVKALDAVRPLPDEADLVRCETTLQSMRLERKPIFEADGLALHRTRHGAWGAAAYILRRGTAERLLAAPEIQLAPIDWMLFHDSCAVARSLNVLQYVPAPSVQDQYHPNVRMRIAFSQETQGKPPLFEVTRNAAKAIAGPAVRLVFNKRIVPFG